MRRIIGVVVVVLVAAYARRIVQLVVVVDMAIGASTRRYCMRTSQSPAELCVIHLRIGPACGVVASLASLWESYLRVRWIVRVLIILQVTRDACRVGEVVVVIDVAIAALARRNRVLARQRESRFRVIELRRRPRRRAVADLAGLRESLLHVIWIGRVLVVLQVARDARRLRQVVVVVDMAIGTLPRRNRMRSG